MNPYVIYGEDHSDSLALRMAARPAHLERLRHLQDEGCLLIGMRGKPRPSDLVAQQPLGEAVELGRGKDSADAAGVLC